MRKSRLFAALLLMLVVLVSCGTTKTVYIEQKLDISDSVDELFKIRPKYYVPNIPESAYELKTFKDIELVLVSTQGLMEEWQDYSYALEQYLLELSKTLKEGEKK